MNGDPSRENLTKYQYSQAQSKLSVPALTPVKLRKRSTATELVLSVVPVESRTSVPVPFWTPPEVHVVKVVEAVVILLPSGIVPVALTATPPKRVASVGLAKLFVQVETVEKSSV